MVAFSYHPLSAFQDLSGSWLRFARASYYFEPFIVAARLLLNHKQLQVAYMCPGILSGRAARCHMFTACSCRCCRCHLCRRCDTVCDNVTFSRRLLLLDVQHPESQLSGQGGGSGRGREARGEGPHYVQGHCLGVRNSIQI